MVFGNYSQLNMLGMGSNMGYQNFFSSGCGFSGFGMNSIFGGSNMFTNCDGSYNYDRMAGYGVGSVVTNCLFGYLGQVAQQRQANKANSQESQLDALKQKQVELQRDVNSLTITYNKKESAYNTARTAYENNEDIIRGKNPSDLANARTIIANYGAATLPEGTEKPTPVEYDKAFALVEAWGKKDQLEADMQRAEREMNAAKEAKETKETELQEVTNQIEVIETANKTKSDDDLLNKADGHFYQQTKEEDYNAKFNDNNELNAGAKVSKNDVRAAIQRFRNAKTDAEKEKSAMQLAQLWTKLSTKDQSDNTLSQAVTIIRNSLSDDNKNRFNQYLDA